MKKQKLKFDVPNIQRIPKNNKQKVTEMNNKHPGNHTVLRRKVLEFKTNQEGGFLGNTQSFKMRTLQGYILAVVAN